jgi:hypothetical protein
LKKPGKCVSGRYLLFLIQISRDRENIIYEKIIDENGKPPCDMS